MAVPKKSTPKKRSIPKASAPEPPVRSFVDATEWSKWIGAQPVPSCGVWMKIAKKDSAHSSVTYPEALDVALTWGWIDGQRRGLDAHWFLQRFTPRGPKSIWSKINCGKVEALIAAGAMKPSGLAEVERAKKDGRWDAAYDGQRTIGVPPDLAEALKANRKAEAFFATLKSNNRYAVLFRVHTAKRPETRQKWIVRLVAMLEREETFH